MTQPAITHPQPVAIDAYGSGYFRVAGQRIDSAVLVLPTTTHLWGGFDDTSPILAAAPEIDVLLVGTGGEIAHLPEQFRTTLEEAGMGIEPMSSPSACRLYNILVSEGRRIGAALLLP